MEAVNRIPADTPKNLKLLGRPVRYRYRTVRYGTVPYYTSTPYVVCTTGTVRYRTDTSTPYGDGGDDVFSNYVFFFFQYSRESVYSI
jgi:hypothetical protein